jgi:hypothetical protein
LSGASIPALPNYVYVVAVGTSDDPTAFHYYWLWVKSTDVSRGKAVEFDLMIPYDDGDLSLGDQN